MKPTTEDLLLAAEVRRVAVERSGSADPTPEQIAEAVLELERVAELIRRARWTVPKG